MDDNAKIFAKRFDDILYEKRMTAAEVSKRTGISEASMSKYRKGVHIPQGQNLQAIANALGVSIEYLLGSDGSLTNKQVTEVYSKLMNNEFSASSVSPDVIDYELNIIEKLPELSDDAKQLISQTVDALIGGNQQNVRFMKAYFDALNRIHH